MWDQSYFQKNKDWWHIGEIGTASHAFKFPPTELDRRIRQGAKVIEINFSGPRTMTNQSYSPGGVGKEARQDMRAMIKINEIKPSVHAPINMTLPPAISREGQGFMPQKSLIDEIKRAIDFAADIVPDKNTKVPVVVHLMGAPRSPITKILDQFGNNYDKIKEYFEKNPETLIFVDKKNKRPIVISTDTELVMKKTDAFGRPIYERKSIGDIITEAIKKTKDKDKLLDTLTREISNTVRLLEREKTLTEAERLKEMALAHAVNEGILSPGTYKLLKNKSIEEIESLAYSPSVLKNEFGLSDDDAKKLSGALREVVESPYFKNASVLYRNYKLTEEIYNPDNLIPIEKYAQQEIVNNIAKIAEETYEKYWKQGKKIAIVPENVLPEYYGGHPEELIKVIEDARKKFVEDLEKKIGKDQAKKIAKEIIGATFDTAHMGLWWKYFQETGKSFEEFKKWYLQQVDEMIKKGIINHVHIVDTMGYADEHLAPGSGRMPLKEVLEKLKKAGYENRIITETFAPGQEFTDAWLGLDLQTYGGKTFGYMRESWISYGLSPATPFITQTYIPSDIFKSWTGVPLE